MNERNEMNKYAYITLPRTVKGSNHGPAWWIRAAAVTLGERGGHGIHMRVLQRIADAMDADDQIVVLDPTRPETIGRFAAEIQKNGGPHTQVGFTAISKAVAAWVPAPLPPPNPPEPTGFGAVVEASCAHSDIRDLWLRELHGNWVPKGAPDTSDDYASLIGVVVKTEGYAGE